MGVFASSFFLCWSSISASQIALCRSYTAYALTLHAKITTMTKLIIPGETAPPTGEIVHIAFYKFVALDDPDGVVADRKSVV